MKNLEADMLIYIYNMALSYKWKECVDLKSSNILISFKNAI